MGVRYGEHVTSAADRPGKSAETTDAETGTGRRYGGKTVEERRAERRDRLLDAGLERFGTAGYPSTTIEGICAAAGVTARHFYEEFGSREELLRAVYDREIDATTVAVVTTMADAVEHPRDLESRVRSGVGAFVGAFLDDPRRARIVCIESVGVSPELEAHRRSVIHAFARILQLEMERLAEAGLTTARDFTLTTRALVGGTNEAVIDWIVESSSVPIEDLATVIADLYLAVILYRTENPA